MKIFLLVGATAMFAACKGAPPVAQPLEFSHERHIKADMECINCHVNAEDKPIASLPNLAKCMECHEEKHGDSADEPKVREYAKRGEEIPWVRVNRLPGHVYFSHGAHLTLAKLKCQDCHGAVETMDKPFTKPNVHLNMQACMSCHDKHNASNSCLTCHK